MGCSLDWGISSSIGSAVMSQQFNYIMKYAPFGVFGLIAVTVANFGFASLIPLAKLVVLVYVAILFFAFVVLGITAKIFGINILILMKILWFLIRVYFKTAEQWAFTVVLLIVCNMKKLLLLFIISHA